MSRVASLPNQPAGSRIVVTTGVALLALAVAFALIGAGASGLLVALAAFLFASMKIAVAAALVGAIVGELPTGAVAGLGARLLAGSYYGQTIQIWSALVTASALAAILVALVGLAESAARRRMGERP